VSGLDAGIEDRHILAGPVDALIEQVGGMDQRNAFPQRRRDRNVLDDTHHLRVVQQALKLGCVDGHGDRRDGDKAVGVAQCGGRAEHPLGHTVLHGTQHAALRRYFGLREGVLLHSHDRAKRDDDIDLTLGTGSRDELFRGTTRRARREIAGVDRDRIIGVARGFGGGCACRPSQSANERRST
jgi:hypothetical protein